MIEEKILDEDEEEEDIEEEDIIIDEDKDEEEEDIEEDIIDNATSEDSNNNDDNNNDESEKQGINEEQNLLINGGLEQWSFLTYYDIPQNWLCYNNDNVRKNSKIVHEGYYSARMYSLKKGSTATINQCISVESCSKIKIRFHYYVEQWKAKGARTYCYFRTREAEVSNIPIDELKAFYDNKTYNVIRGGGYGLTFFPHDLNVWQVFDETIEVPPTANFFVFGINSYYGTTIYIDDCWVIDVSEHSVNM